MDVSLGPLGNAHESQQHTCLTVPPQIRLGTSRHTKEGRQLGPSAPIAKSPSKIRNIVWGLDLKFPNTRRKTLLAEFRLEMVGLA